MRARRACIVAAGFLLLLLVQTPAGAWLSGIDISGHQTVTSWSQLHGAKDYVMMKASEGIGYTDSTFYSNQAGARGQGMLRGFYHYSRPDLGTSATAEANWFCSVVGTMQYGEVLMLDFEILEKDWNGDGPGWCKTFLDRCYAITGVKPAIYLYFRNPGTYDRDWTAIANAGYQLWLAVPDYNPNPTVGVGGTPWSYVANKQYTWGDSSMPVPGIVPAASGGLYVDLDSFNGDANKFMSFGVGPPPTITTHPQSQTVCNGTNVTFTAAATGVGTLYYQWRRGGSNISGATATSYTTNVAGSYDCLVTDPWGSTATNAATLTIRTPASITTQPTTQQVGFGVKGTFSVVAAGTSPTYQWQRNGTNISGAINSTYTTGNPGSYRCVVTNACATATSNAASLVINNATWVSTVAAAKALPDGTIVGISQGPVVTRSMGSVWYVEDGNRACGLRVIPAPSNTPSEADVATIYGSLTTIDGERLLGGALINNTADTSPLAPLAMTCDSAAKPLSQGLYARLCGKVTVPPDAYNSFTLNDGSATSFTVMLYGPATPADGSYVNLRGVIGQESYGPVLRVNKSTDIW